METQHSLLKQRIIETMKLAMKARDKPRLATIRLIQAAIKQREVDERIELTDLDIVTILNKMLKQRHDSISHYQAGGRQDLVAQEVFEISIIQAYLPEPMSDAEISQLIDQAFVASGAKTAADMGKVMAILKPKLQGRAELSAISQHVKAKLAN